MVRIVRCSSCPPLSQIQSIMMIDIARYLEIRDQHARKLTSSKNVLDRQRRRAFENIPESKEARRIKKDDRMRAWAEKARRTTLDIARERRAKQSVVPI